MNAKLLRILWSAVSETPPHVLIGVDDLALSRHLIGCIESRMHMSREESTEMHSYISARTPLIRDLAYS
ncbi:MAG: hypothetical protein AAFZ80_06180 [Cyanobacteria bacterium P01_A01_bin.105]